MKYTTDSYIERCEYIHNNKYDYTLVEYNGSSSSIKITCKEHGVFEQRAFSHLQGQGCSKCKFNEKKKGLDDFILKSNITHSDKYDYSLVHFKTRKDKVKIICKEHGIFEQRAADHIRGNGCANCYFNSNIKDNLYFIEKASKIHNNKYEYVAIYEKAHSLIDIECKKHGIFKQKANAHLNGQGCPKCNTSKGENIIESILIEKGINYIKGYKFDDCKYKQSLPFDFYLPDYNLCVEYDGIQHFEVIEFFGGKEKFDYRKNNDSIKNKYCISKNIRLSRISYKDDILNKIEEIL